MPVPTSITDLSTTASSNYPGGTDSVAANTGPDDYFRAHAAIIRTLAAADTIAAASTVDLSTKNNTFITLTGTATTINALGTVAAGVYKWLIYNAAHTVTHNATSLILMGGATRTVVAGDASLFVSEGSGNWRELDYSPKGGYALLSALTASGGSALVGFLQSGTGGQATTVQAKLRQRVSAFDFMTSAQIASVQAMNLVEDVTTAIQAAIDSLASTGGIIHFPPGIYKTTATLTVTNGITLQGSGFNKNTSRLSPTSAVGWVIKGSNFDAAGDNSQIAVKDLSIAGTYGDFDGYIAIQGFWIELSNLKLEGANATAGTVLLKDGQYATLHNLIFLNHASAGTAGAGYGVVLDNFNSVFGTVDVEGAAVGLDLKNGAHACNIVGRYELCPIGVQIDGDDNILHGVFANCATRWISVTGTSRNNRITVSRESNTNVPATPVNVVSGANDNWIYTDESVNDNDGNNTIVGNTLKLGTTLLQRVRVFSDGDATPSVADGNVFRAANTGATSITAFDDGVNGQTITVRADSANTTIVHNAGAGMYLNGSANFSMTAGSTITLLRENGYWFETGRSTV